MPLEDMIIHVFCLVSDLVSDLAPVRRRRGPCPALTDAEVLTIEVVGEMLGLETDKQIWLYFRRHWQAWFPGLGCRSSFVRQSANLYAVKQTLQWHLARRLEGFSDSVHLIDGFPLRACRLSRACHCQRFKGTASYGYCATQKEYYYGFKAVLVTNSVGIPVALALLPANQDEREAVEETTRGLIGYLFGDKGYISLPLQDDLRQRALALQTPLRKNMTETRDPRDVQLLKRFRRRIETVIGELAERFHIEKIWARDLWHLTSRLYRKLLSYTVALFLCRHLGGFPPSINILFTA